MKTYKTYKTKNGYRKINFVQAYDSNKDKTTTGFVNSVLNCKKDLNKGLFMLQVNNQILNPEDFNAFHCYYINDKELRKAKKKQDYKAKVDYQIIIK